MTRLYLIRHAEAEGNLYRRIHGDYDSLITDNGYRQISALERRFASIHVDAVYSSDLFRTMTTAGAVYRPKGLPLRTDRRLREVHMGIWEDRPWGEVARMDGEGLRRHNGMDPTWTVEGGETFQILRARMEEVLREIAARHEGETVAVFSHGTAIRNALAVFRGMTIPESAALGHSDNTAVSLLEFAEDEVRVVFENDSSHLTEEISTLARQHWWRAGGGSAVDHNLWFRPLDVLGEEAAFYREAREEAWHAVYPDGVPCDTAGFLTEAEQAARFDPWLVVCAMLGEERAGILELRPGGHIAFYYLKPSYRGQGLGIQLVGQAVGYFRPRGVERLTLCCSPENVGAQRFYHTHGFRRTGTAPGVVSPLDVLEKDISYQERDQ